MKILVTGANGFLGKNLVPHLQDHELFIPTHTECDYLDFNSCIAATKGMDCVIHLATVVQQGKKPFTVFSKNERMNLNILEAIKKNNVPRFITTGTILSYPDTTKPPFSEEDISLRIQTHSKNEYAASKLSLLVGTQALHHECNTHCTFLLLPNIFGKYDNYEENRAHFVPTAIKKILAAKKEGAQEVRFLRPGESLREFAYADDVVSTICSLLTLDGLHVLNVGCGHVLSPKQFAEKIAATLKHPCDISFPKGDEPEIHLNGDKIRSLITVEKTAFTTALQETIDWYLTSRS